MDLTPKTVVVTVPVNIPELRGRHATTKPHGFVITFRAPNSTMTEVDMAISRIDPKMSRGLFMRLVVHNVAKSINQHYDDIRRQAEDITNGHSTGP